MDINLEHGRYTISPEQLGSEAGRALLRVRDDLVLQLFFKRGPFWDAVRDVREAQRAERWYWRQIIDEIGKRPQRPLGLDIWGLLDDVVND